MLYIYALALALCPNARGYGFRGTFAELSLDFREPNPKRFV